VGRTGAAIPTAGVSVLWSDPQGRVLFGTIDEWHRGKGRPKKTYFGDASPSFRAWRRVGLHPVAGGWRYVRFAVAAAGIQRTSPRGRRRHRRGPIAPMALSAEMCGDRKPDICSDKRDTGEENELH
jgi:hypothetical protein